jgi:hypothetical protein
VQRDYDFNVTKTELYIEGYCQRCQDEAHKIALGGEAPNLSPKQIETQKTDKKISEKRKAQRRFKRK